MADNYSDIINNPHHKSKVRKRMSPLNRAAQFAPFAALTGYDSAISESARLTTDKLELDEKSNEILNCKLNLLKEFLSDQPEITVTYFAPDPQKSGGAYVDYTGNIRLIDEYEQVIIMTDRTKISINQIYNISCKMFDVIQT